MNDFLFNRATEKDATLIKDLLKSLYLELGEENQSVKFLTDKFISGILNSGRTEIYMAATKTAESIGLVTLTECQSIYAGGKYGLLDEMYIKPSYRSKGVGAELIKKIKLIGLKRNWKRIDVTAPTEEKWKRTVEFYKKNGFTFTGPKLKMDL